MPRIGVRIMPGPWIKAKALADELGKPLLTIMMGDAEIMKAQEIMNQNGIPLYFTPETVAAAMARLYEYQQYRA